MKSCDVTLFPTQTTTEMKTRLVPVSQSNIPGYRLTIMRHHLAMISVSVAWSLSLASTQTMRWLQEILPQGIWGIYLYEWHLLREMRLTLLNTTCVLQWNSFRIEISVSCDEWWQNKNRSWRNRHLLMIRIVSWCVEPKVRACSAKPWGISVHTLVSTQQRLCIWMVAGVSRSDVFSCEDKTSRWIIVCGALGSDFVLKVTLNLLGLFNPENKITTINNIKSRVT